MAPAFVAVAEWFAGVFGSAAVGSFVLAAEYAVAYAAAVYIINSAVASLTRKKPGQDNSSRGLEFTITDTGQGGFAIYGRVRASGVNVIPPITSGTDGRYLEQGLALALHEVDGYGDVYVDDTVIRSSAEIGAVGGASTDGLVTSGKYSSIMWVRRYNGNPSENADFILTNRYPSLFTSDFRGRGIAKAFMTYDWFDGKVYTGFPIMIFDIRGKKCYDPRLDTSPGAHPTDPTYIFWTHNPALCWADYAMADFGGSVSAGNIDWTSVVNAANICDGIVTVGGSFGTSYTADGTATMDTANRIITKPTGTGAYDASIRSTVGVKRGSISMVCNTSSSRIVFGFNSDPATDANYTGIDFAWYFEDAASGQHYYTYVSGSGSAALGTWTAGKTILKIDYDGTCIRWFVDDVLIRTGIVGTPGMTLYFDSSINTTTTNVTIDVQHRYTMNGRLFIPTEPDWRENAKTMVDAMLGRMVRRGDKWYIYAGAYDTPSYTINKTDWTSIDSIKTVSPRDGGRWNTCRVWYVDPLRNWQRVECFPRRNATYKSADGAEEIAIEMEQPACIDEFEAQRKGEFILRQSRNQVAIAGKLPPRFRKLVTGDTVAVNFEELGYVSKVFRVRTMSLYPDGSQDVALIEEQASDWTDLAASEYNAPSVSTIPTTNPTTPTAPSSFNLDTLTVTGTILWKIGLPVVIPKDTKYQIIRGSTSNNAAVGTVIYDGDLTSGMMQAPSSAQYYWARAYAGSYYGPYFPNTTGTLIGPLIWTIGQGTNVTSYGVSDNEIVRPVVLTTDAAGKLVVNGVVEGRASFDHDSGTSFNLIVIPQTLTNTALGIVQPNSGGFTIGAGGQFSPGNSGWSFVTLGAQVAVSSGITYVIGVNGFVSFGVLAMRNIVVNHQFIRD